MVRKLRTKKYHIARALIVGITSFLFLSNVMSCATTTTIPRSEYSGIESSEQQDYKVKLKDGTKYQANRIDVDDSTLTILAMNNSAGTRNEVLISDQLPYSIDLDEVDSIVLRKSSPIIMYLYVGVMVVLVSLAIIVYNLDLSNMPN